MVKKKVFMIQKVREIIVFVLVHFIWTNKAFSLSSKKEGEGGRRGQGGSGFIYNVINWRPVGAIGGYKLEHFRELGHIFLLLSRYLVTKQHAVPRTIAHRAPLMGFPGQEYWSGLPFLLQGIFPAQGSNPCLLHWQVDSLSLSHLGSPKSSVDYIKRESLNPASGLQLKLYKILIEQNR